MTRNVRYSPPSEQEISAQAAEWLLRLDDTETDPDEPYPNPLERQKQFLAWLRQSPAHIRAFIEIAHTYRKLGYADPKRLIDLDSMLAQTETEQGPQLVAMLPSVRRVPYSVLRPRLRRLAVAAAIAAVAYFLGALLPFPEVAAAPTYYSTKKGERQVISLDDGSTIYINSGSRISVELDRHLRSVHLLEGEALFHVQHTITPFHVIVDDAVIEDLGTQFDVYRTDNATQVSVSEGLVQIYCDCADLSANANAAREKTGARRQPPFTLEAGEQAILQREANSTRIQRTAITAFELERKMSWKDGRLSFQGEPLGEAIKDFNRYNSVQLLVDDPAVAQLRVGGTFPIHDINQFIAALHDTFGITAEATAAGLSNPNTIRLIRADKPGSRTGD